MPTGTENLYKKLKEKEQQSCQLRNQELIDKYGGIEHLKQDYTLMFAQTEKYNEFTRDGKVKNTMDRGTIKSKFEEDIYLNNHVSVWGSWWNEELGNIIFLFSLIYLYYIFFFYYNLTFA